MGVGNEVKGFIQTMANFFFWKDLLKTYLKEELLLNLLRLKNIVFESSIAANSIAKY